MTFTAMQLARTNATQRLLEAREALAKLPSLICWPDRDHIFTQAHAATVHCMLRDIDRLLASLVPNEPASPLKE